MTELSVTGARILDLGRRLLATPPLAEMPAAYEALLRDPGELLEATWGAVAHGEPAPEEPPASRAARAERASGGAAFSPLNSAAFEPNALLFPDRPARPAAAGSPGTQTPSAGTKAVPLRLTEDRPPALTTSAFAPVVKDESRAASSLRQGTAPGLLPLELVRDEQATVGGDSPEPLERGQTKKVVEWPAAPPAAGAALAAPGNVRQELEEEWGAEPELQVLRGQLGEDEGKRERLQTERARETFREGGTEGRRTGDDPAGLPAARTPTSFSPLASLLSKNVSRTETAPAPLVPEVLSGGGSLWSSPDEEKRAVAERAGGERTDETRRRAAAPTVDEVLEELYERLRLEFSRTYGTTGG